MNGVELAFPPFINGFRSNPLLGVARLI